MKSLTYIFLFLMPLFGYTQGLSLKSGDNFPAISINQLVNAPHSTINLHSQLDKKIYILNFWGTWCSPCIPEMDALTKLQKVNADKIQVIGMSDDSKEKLQRYLKNKPTSIWLATDTNYFLYNLFNFSSVGHSAIINSKREIIALTKTHSITQGLLDSIYKGLKIKSDAELREKAVSRVADVFNVDSTLSHNFTVRGYMAGQDAMGRTFKGKSVFADRRINFVNTNLTTIYKAAFDIVSSKQIIYEVDEKKIENYQDKTQRYCVDILVKPEEKDSLYVIFQRKLNATLPVKAKIIYKNIPVYVLSNHNFSLEESDKESSYGFSGRGYEGTAVRLSDFANDYLSNELPIPVVDETGLKGKYDIKTTVEMRTQEEIMKSVTKLGLRIEKQERKMRMLVLY